MGSTTFDKIRTYFGYTTGALGAGIGEAIGGTGGAIIGGLAGTALGAAIQPGKRNQKLKATAISGAGALAVAGTAAIAKAASGQDLSRPISITEILGGGAKTKPAYADYAYDSLGRRVVDPGTGMVVDGAGRVVPGYFAAGAAAAASSGGSAFDSIVDIGGKIVGGLGKAILSPASGASDGPQGGMVGPAVPADYLYDPEALGVGGAGMFGVPQANPLALGQGAPQESGGVLSSIVKSPVALAAGFLLLVLVLR